MLNTRKRKVMHVTVEISHPHSYYSNNWAEYLNIAKPLTKFLYYANFN